MAIFLCRTPPLWADPFKAASTRRTCIVHASSSPPPPLPRRRPPGPPGNAATSTPPPSRELIERERERWGHGTARASERGVDGGGKGRKKGSRDAGGAGGPGKKKAAPRRPRAKGDRGRGPMVLCWRMYNVELPVAVDPGKDFCGVSPEVRRSERDLWGGVACLFPSRPACMCRPFLRDPAVCVAHAQHRQLKGGCRGTV